VPAGVAVQRDHAHEPALREVAVAQRVIDERVVAERPRGLPSGVDAAPCLLAADPSVAPDLPPWICPSVVRRLDVICLARGGSRAADRDLYVADVGATG
jgi:hypothetical protein